MSAYKDAQAQNDISRNVRQYTDLDLFFTKKIVGSDVNKVTDIQAVKRSLRNLINLNEFEKPFHPEIAGGIRDMLFEPMSPIVAAVLARLVSVRAIPDFDRNIYNVSIEFYVVNAPTELVDLSIMLERIR